MKGIAWLLKPGVFPFVVLPIYLVVSFLSVAHSVDTPRGQKDLTEGDSKAYIRHAHTFAKGDFSLDHVEDKPHRQPLYPLLLAPAVKFSDGSLFWMASVNIYLAVATFVLIYLGILRLFHSPFAAAVTGVFFLTNPFVYSEVTRHLLTEPLHFLFMMAVIFSLLIYLRGKRPVWLLVAAAMTGLEYLARVNGIFVMASLIGAVVLEEALKWVFSPDKTVRVSAVARRLGLYGAAVLLFLVVSTPSWLPRLNHFGDPFHHGYLSNYMWVDTYEEGHTGANFATFTWRDYAATHDLGDVVQRALHGIWEVGFDIPTRIEKPPVLFILSLFGAALALWRGPLSLRIVFIFGSVQLLPLMWTHMSNPTVRVPYAASFPFELFFTAVLVAFLAALPWSEWWTDRENLAARLKAWAPASGKGDLSRAPRRTSPEIRHQEKDVW